MEQRIEQPREHGITRRQFSRRALGAAVTVTGPGLAGALGARAAWAQAAKSSGEVVVCTWGGSYTESQKKAFFDPFEQETGIRVRRRDPRPGEDSGHGPEPHAVEWDPGRRRGQMMLRLAGQDMLERADFSIIPGGTSCLRR